MADNTCGWINWQKKLDNPKTYDFFRSSTSKGAAIQYKYIMRQGTSTTWETGANRTYTVPSSGSGTRNESWRF